MSLSPQPFRVGLTGGIAAGKSAVAELWRQRGATVVDSDALAHAALAPGTPTHATIVAHFGAGIRNADGTINRAALGEIVFGNEQHRQALNQIVHPTVRQQWRDALRTANTPVTVAMVPLLYEVGVEKDFDCIVVVACSEATQLARLTGDKGLTVAQARARIAAQWPMPRKMDRADYVIWNDGSRQTLAEQAAIIWERIKENHHATRPT